MYQGTKVPSNMPVAPHVPHQLFLLPSADQPHEIGTECVYELVTVNRAAILHKQPWFFKILGAA